MWLLLLELILLYVCKMIIIIYLVNWCFCTCLVLYVVSSHLNFCNWYVYGFFIRNDLFVCLLTVCYLIFRLLIDFLLLSICMFFVYLDYCNMYIIGCFYKQRFLCLFMNIYILYLIHWLILLLLSFVCYFFPFEILEEVCHWLF